MVQLIHQRTPFLSFSWLPLVATGLIVCLSVLSAGCTNEDARSPVQSRQSVDETTAGLLIQSQQALQQGELRAARILADSVVVRAPRLPDAHFQRGRVLSELKEFDDAEAAYRDVLALDPNYRGVWYNLGNNAYREQQYDDAVDYYRRAHALHPSAQALVSLGWTYVAQDEIDQARRAYEDAIARDSSYALAYARLGQLHDDQGNLDEALKYSRQAVERAPRNGKYQYALGSQLLRLDRPEDAVDHLRRAVDLQPWSQSAHFSLGQALTRLGRQQDGERYLARADSLEQQQSEIRRLRAVARGNPDNPAVWTQLGEALRSTGQLDAAQEAFSLALYINPHDPQLRNTIAMLAAQTGNSAAAVDHYRALLNQHPSYVEGWFNLGVVYARSGAPEKAQEAWKQVLKYQPGHERAQAYLARIASDGS